MKRKKNKLNSAREKYLLLDHSINPEEQSLIDQELNSDDFSNFKQDSGSNLVLPEKYSAEETYSLIRVR